MAIRIKICGINSADAADAAARAGADFAGLVIHPASPRNLTLEAAASLSGRLRGRAKLATLIADLDDDRIAAIIAAVKPDFLQLHGAESAARASAIHTRFGVPLIKVFSIAESSDFAAVPAFDDIAAMFLFDAKAPASAARGGGHGVAFDWQLLRGRTFARPWLLAGGLNAGNVARAIEASGAPGVDVSSGVESAPGVKSPAMIEAFVAAARAAQFAVQA
ncbi:MAG TPA: phosphoribosylanthranilate isomerase [Rhizomicrobium sp.]